MTSIQNDQSRDVIRQFFSRRLKNITLNDEENIFEMGLVDSLFAMQIMTFVEKTFDFECSDDDLEINNFCSIKNITNFVNKKLDMVS